MREPIKPREAKSTEPRTGRQRARYWFVLADVCERCNEAPAVDRHHVDGDPLNNVLENIQSLCRRCHMDVDGRLYQRPPRRTHCKHGHEFNAENTYTNPTTGKRACKTCVREHGRRFEAGVASLTSLAHVIEFDPLLDKSYRRAKLGRDVVAWLDYLDAADLSPRTIDSYERVLARLCKMFPNTELREFTDAELLSLSRRFKPAERRVRMAAVSSFFKWAKITRRIDDNPTQYLPQLRKKPQRVPDVFTEGEVASLLSLDVVDAAPLAVLVDAGLRKAEARLLRLKDCLPDVGHVVVRNGKGGRDRVIPMSARLAKLLADLEIIEGLEQADHIFYGVRANEVSRRRVRNQPIGEGTFARWWRRCLEQAEVRYRNPHVARHTFATTWRRRGLSIDELQLLLGHASISTTADIYTHTNVDDVARHMALIEAGEV
jgi:integrase/recombinase XerD